MTNYDPKKAAAVWQRVQAQKATLPEPTDLLTLIAQAQEAATTYLHLSRQFSGKESAALRQMAYTKQSHAACLRGLCALMNGQRPQLRVSPAPRENRLTALRRCYGKEMQSLAAYQAKAGDPQYGHIFSRLTQQTQDHCQLLLGILGNLKA